MDSLLANYASSDSEEEEGEIAEEHQNQNHGAQISKNQESGSELSKPRLKFSLPPPRDSNPSFPKPSKNPSQDDSEDEDKDESSLNTAAAGSIFSKIPAPKSSTSFDAVFSHVPESKSTASDSSFSSISAPKSRDADSMFSSLAAPKSRDADSMFSSLAAPKSRDSDSIFTSIPAPKSRDSVSGFSRSLPQPKNSNGSKKKVVEFKLPVLMPVSADEDEDEYEHKGDRFSKKDDSESAKSSLGGLSAILPAPKNKVLGSGLALGSGNASRRNILDAPSNAVADNSSVGADHSSVTEYASSVPDSTPVYDPNLGASSFPEDTSNGYYGNVYNAEYDSSGSYASDPASTQGGSGDVAWTQQEQDYYYSQQYLQTGPSQDASYGPSYEASYGAPMTQKKRGRNQVSENIIEVKQDDLMKNKPREDQSKTTGIAFGPSYRPVSAAKDKPNKLQKRKHQIGSLYFDLKQKEMELQERRSKGMLTKAETQAKYGW